LLNILRIPFACTSSLSSMAMILSLVFWWSQWILAFCFHRSWVV
jgi:hypothetical protein